MIRSLLLLSAAAIPLCAAQSSIRSDGVMLVEGRPFVPLGIYYNNRHRGAALAAADMRAIADAGLNCIETSQIQAWDQPDAGLDAVRTAGLRGFLEASWQSSETAAWASARANRSEIVGWNLADDAHRRFTVEQMSAMKATARAAVPNQILYQTAYDGAAMGPYLPFTDTTWGYRYPTYNKAEGADQSAVGSIIMRPLQNSGVPFMAIPQAYRWDDDANSTGNRFPTAKEYRCQAWQGLACGAKGLIAYAMTDTTNAPWLPTAAPDLWQEIIATAHDVSDLRWVIADGARTSIAMSGDPYWFYGAAWSWHGARLIAVTNASDASRSISTTITDVPAGTLSSVGRASASAWSWNGTTLSGTLAPAETCLFRIGSLANAAPVIATSAPAIPANGSGTLTLATDADGDALTVTVLSGPTHGRLTGSGATVTYQPDPGYTGSDAIQVAVHDGWNDATGTMTLAVQDTGAVTPAVTIVASGPAAGEPSNPGTFTITRSVASAEPLTVSVICGGSATAGSDYLPLASTVVIAANQASATVTVTPIDDTLIEPAETVVLTLSNGTGYTVGASSSATVTIADDDAPGTLPAGWSALDIGSPVLAGSTTYASATNTWTVTGSGADIWNTSDSFQAAAQTITGDVTVVARVTAIGNTNVWAKAGIMLRDGTAAGAKHAFVCVTAGNGVAFQRRVATGEFSSYTAGSTSRAPRWIKMQRSGSNFTAWESADGVAWTKVGTSTITMGASIQVMLAVTAHDPTQRCEATFTNLTITPAGNG